MDASRLFAARFRPGWRLLFALLLGTVAWFAFMPGTPLVGFAHTDKLQHGLAFASLAVVGMFAGPPDALHEARVAIGLWLFGVLIELVQTQLPTRTASVADVLADVAGIALGLLLARQVDRWVHGRHPSI